MIGAKPRPKDAKQRKPFKREDGEGAKKRPAFKKKQTNSDKLESVQKKFGFKKKTDPRRLQEDKAKQEVAKLNALPNTFLFAAEALKSMSEKVGSAGSIIVKKYKSYNYKLIYALVMNTIKNIAIVKKIIHEIKLAKKVTVNDPFLLEILVGDLLYGKGLKSVEQNPTAVAILKHKDVIVKQQNLLKQEYQKNKPADLTAKYLRINHVKSNMAHVMSQLKTIGLKQVEYSKDKIKFKKFINKFKDLAQDEYLVDFHFPNDLIVLKPEAVERLQTKTDLLKKGKALLQDKASFLAVEAMGLKPGDKVIDACCAPGGKTSLIGNKLKNKGKILAYDMDKKRLLSAKHLLKVQGITCASLDVHDFTKVKLRRLLKAHKIEEFDSILIDPSCSGSGISSRVDYKSTHSFVGRLKKLQAFQVAMLKHALKATISKSIIYCTCSSSTEENETVIEMALNESGVKSLWDVAEVIPYWPLRGEANYEFGAKCLRSNVDNLTNGFFIAKLVRNSTPQINQDPDDEIPELVPSKEIKKSVKDENCKIESNDMNQEHESELEEEGEEDEEVEDELEDEEDLDDEDEEFVSDEEIDD